MHSSSNAASLGAQPPGAAPPPPSGSDDPQETADTRRPRGGRAPVRGVLLEAAEAPYRFDPAARRSFYVLLRTEVGERRLWGAGLEAALQRAVSQPRIGDEVVVLPLGTKPVRLRVPAQDGHADAVGEERVLAQRRQWRIETQDHMHMLAQEAQQLRADRTPSPGTMQRDPRLTYAMAGLRLAAQYAQRLTADPRSQQQLLASIRHRIADALADGLDIHLPDRRVAMARAPILPGPGRAAEWDRHAHERP